MTARLYQFATSPFCAKVRKILDYKGVDYEAVEVDYLQRGELLVASGQIMVPALTFESGETIVDSARITARLEELFPNPTVFPPSWRGLHLAMARYIDSEIEDAAFRVALSDELEHYRMRGADRLALFRLIRERKYGAGFCDRMVAERDANLARLSDLLAPFDEALADRAFLFGRIGYADFALYSQLHLLELTGESRLPPEFKNLREFHGRVDRITSALGDNAG
ncbi:MAG TPA: glutathione S-transferase family protein [Candidatus Binataceae bacterium]|nr:glutathione S-transferase family protein [Candidatus Binataceae bacterium]HVA68058.1 glutathione S-transferase family protein [Candidatus Binataceae bacterium]